MVRLILAALMVGVLVPMMYAEEPMSIDQQIDAAHKHLELKKLELQGRSMEAEVEFGQQMHKIELEAKKAAIGHSNYKGGKGGHDRFGHLICLVIMLVHILTAVWVYQDTKKTGISGIWIVITLLAGLLGALVYGVIRIGQQKEPQV